MNSIENNRFIRMHILIFLSVALAVFHISPYTERRSVLGVDKRSLRLFTWNAQTTYIPPKIFYRSRRSNKYDGGVMYYPQSGQLLIDGALIYSFSHHNSEVLTNLDKVPLHFEDIKKNSDWSIIPTRNVNKEIRLNECLAFGPNAFLTFWKSSTYNKYPEEEFIVYRTKYKQCLENLRRYEQSEALDLCIVSQEPVLIKNNGYCMTLIENQPEGIDYMRTRDRRFVSSIDLSHSDPEKQFFREYSGPYHIEPEKYDKYASLRLRMRACTSSQDQLFYIWNDEEICDSSYDSFDNMIL